MLRPWVRIYPALVLIAGFRVVEDADPYRRFPVGADALIGPQSPPCLKGGGPKGRGDTKICVNESPTRLRREPPLGKGAKETAGGDKACPYRRRRRSCSVGADAFIGPPFCPVVILSGAKNLKDPSARFACSG